MMEWILTSTVLILAVILVRAVLGRRMGPKLRYGLWLLVLVRLLLPFSFGQSAASPANLVRVQEPAVFVAPMVTAPPEDVGVTVEPSGAVLDSNAMGHAVVNDADGTVTRYASTFDLKEVLFDLLPKIWVIGMAAAAAWFLFCNLAFYRDLRRSRNFLRTEGKVPVYVADAPSPCLFGLFRPAIYVTPEAAAGEEMLKHTLLHERTHLRHGDHIWAFLRTVCLILWWYHPLVWLAARLSRQDSELFCDAAVIDVLGEEHRAEYGRTLLALSNKRRPAPAFCAASTLSRGGRQLKDRINAIARWAKPKKWAIVLALVIAAIAVGCAFTGAAQPQEADPEPDDAKTQVVTATNPESSRTPGPLTDRDLTGGSRVYLGMPLEDISAVLPFADAELLGYTAEMQTYMLDSNLYTFTLDEADGDVWLSSVTSNTDENFLSLGIGVGSTLEQVVSYLGCDPADDPGADQMWQLYGADGELSSAQVAPGETDGIRFLSIWTENGGCQFQLQQGTVIQASAYLSRQVELRAVTDANLGTVHGIKLGMPYDEVLDLLGPTATVTERPNLTLVEQDGITFLFRDLGDGMKLLDYSSNAVGTELPLGLTVGGSIDGLLRDAFGVIAPPELPLSEPLFLYGSEETSMSALLDISLIEDVSGHLEIYTEHYLFRCRLNEDRTILYADCSDRDEMSTLSLFKTTPEFQDCTPLDSVDFNQYTGYSGAMVYTRDDNVPQVVYCVLGYRKHFTAAELPRIGTGVEYQAGSLRQVSGEEITFTLKDTATGQLLQWQIAPRWNHDGTVAFVSGPASDAPAAQPEDSADDRASDSITPTADYPPLTREEMLTRLANDDYFYNADVLAAVPFDDPDGRLGGVALCQRKNGIPWVVYMPLDPEADLCPMGMGSGNLDYVDGTFGYADGKASMTFRDRNLEQDQDYAVTYTVTSTGSLAFSTEVSSLLLNRFASYAMRVLDYQELPGDGRIDGVLVVSRDDSLILPMICYCLDLESTSTRFIFIPPVGDGTSLEYQVGTLRVQEDGTIFYNLINPSTGTLYTKTVQPGDDPTDETQYNQWFTP